MALIGTSYLATLTDRVATAAVYAEAAAVTLAPMIATANAAIIGQPAATYGPGDVDLAEDLARYLRQGRDNVGTGQLVPGLLDPYVAGLNSHIAVDGKTVASSIVDLDTYATYYNGLAYHSMLYSYGFARLYHLWTSRAAMLSAGNVMGSSVVLATGRVTGTIALSTTDAGTLATANDLANGIQGVSADDLCIRVISGTLTGTIVATGAKQGAASTAYWAGTVATLTSAGTRHLLTGPAGSFCWDVTGLSYNGNGTVATFTVESYGRAL